MHGLTSQPPSLPVETPRDNGVLPRRDRPLRPRACAIALLAVTAALAAGCTGSLLPSTASSNQSASPTATEGVVPRLRPQLVATNRSFLDTSAGRDAQKKMDMGSMGGMPGMKGMKGMDNMPGMGSQQKMPGMEGMSGMENGQMPGMGGSPSPAATPPKPGGMEGMHASRMPGMGGSPPPSKTPGDMGGMPGMQGTGSSEPKPAGPAMPGMDPAMPGMNGAQPSGTAKPPPADRQKTIDEMKKLSDEMKKASDALKAKADAMKADRNAQSPTPVAEPTPAPLKP